MKRKYTAFNFQPKKIVFYFPHGSHFFELSDSMTFSMNFSSFRWPQISLSPKKVSKLSLSSGIFFSPNSVQQTNSDVHQHACPSIVLFNYLSLLYFVLALTSTVTYLPNISSIFHNFPWPAIKFHSASPPTPPVDV